MSATIRPAWAAITPDAQTEALRQSALRKNAWRLLPLLTLAYVFNYIDRTTVGFAGLTMNRDLGLSATQFGWGAGILFFGYCFFEIPSNMAMHYFGARRWLARIMITWGLAAAATGLVTGPMSFYVVRFLLGVAEAGFFPGVAYMLGAWFPPRYRTQVLAGFLVAVPLSSVVGGPFSVLLLEMEGIGGLHGWQWMFIIQGLPTCILGLFTLSWLRDSPAEAHWLTPAERDALLALLAEEKRERVKKSFAEAIADPRVLMLALIQFGFIVGSYGLGIWLPLILKSTGMANLTIGFVSTIPYILATIVMLVWARAVDQSGSSKIINLAATCFLCAGGMAGSVLAGSLIPSLVALSVALIGTSTARAIFWAIPTRFLTGAGAAAGLALINSVGAFGGFVGPFTMGWLRDQTGSFNAGLLTMTAFGALAGVLTLCLRFLVREE